MIELLIVIVLLSFLGGVVYSTLYQGVQLWKRAIREDPSVRAQIFMDRLTQDLRNAVSFSGIPFVGKRKSLEFIKLESVAFSKDQKLPWGKEQLTRVEYAFEPGTQRILRKTASYIDLLKLGPDEVITKIGMQEIENFELSYAAWDEDSSSIYWKPQWLQACFPRAVKVSLAVGGEDLLKRTKIIPIQIHQCTG